VAFGQAVRRHRKALSLSQEKLALMAGINRTYMGDVERGERNIALRNMMKIAEVLETKLSDLMRTMELELRKLR
jgi:transcriptional regulator with XRE-family HTH domain